MELSLLYTYQRKKKRIILSLKLQVIFKISTFIQHVIYKTTFFTCYLYVKLLVNSIFENFMVQKMFWFSKNFRFTCKLLVNNCVLLFIFKSIYFSKYFTYNSILFHIYFHIYTHKLHVYDKYLIIIFSFRNLNAWLLVFRKKKFIFNFSKFLRT